MLTVTAEPDEIRRRLDRIIATDPVRHTILGTIRDSLGDRDAVPWCAETADGAALAARSEAVFPVVVAGGWDDATRRELVLALLELPDLAGVAGPEAQVAPLADALVPVAARPRPPMRQRLFRLDALVEPTGVTGVARRASAADRDLVIEWYRAFGVEAGALPADIERAAAEAVSRGEIWLWTDHGAPVALAARRSAVAGSARVGPVYTPPSSRGRGFGSAVTAAATADVLADGAIPVLFTDLANPVSNSIYPKLGYYPVEDRLIVRFG